MFGVSVNLWAVLVAAVASMIVGTLWYGPLFGKQWMKMMGFTNKDMEKAKAKGMGKTYFAAFIGSLVMAYVLAVIVGLEGSMTAESGAMVGLLVGIGFKATSALDGVLWECKPSEMFWLNAIGNIVILTVMGAIIGAW